MSEGTAQPQPGPAISSTWRLVNLALGISGGLTFIAAVGVPWLVPSRWLLAPWVTPGSMQAVPGFALVLARIGINLWLPASVLLVLFCAAGLHRRAMAPSRTWARIALTVTWATHIALTVFTALARGSDAAGGLLFMMGMFLAPVYFALIVAAFAAAATELRSMAKHPPSVDTRTPVALWVWALLPPVLSVVPWLLSASNPSATSSNQGGDSAADCRDAGVRFSNSPAGAVRSIAFDWPATLPTSPTVQRVQVDKDGRWLGSGGGPMPGNAEAQKKLAFEYVESRRHHQWFLDMNMDAMRREVDTFGADVIAFLEIDKPEELAKAPARQGALRHTITLTDRRSGRVLGAQTYVIDMANRRACGANVEGAISPSAFIYDAIHR